MIISTIGLIISLLHVYFLIRNPNVIMDIYDAFIPYFLKDLMNVDNKTRIATYLLTYIFFSIFLYVQLLKDYFEDKKGGNLYVIYF